jgi:uncharacterized protein (UPF0261 family)
MLDTKDEECRYFRGRVLDGGSDVLTMAVGVLVDPAFAAGLPRRERAAATANVQLVALEAASDHGAALDALGRGAARTYLSNDVELLELALPYQRV